MQRSWRTHWELCAILAVLCVLCKCSAQDCPPLGSGSGSGSGSDFGSGSDLFSDTNTISTSVCPPIPAPTPTSVSSAQTSLSTSLSSSVLSISTSATFFVTPSLSPTQTLASPSPSSSPLLSSTPVSSPPSSSTPLSSPSPSPSSQLPTSTTTTTTTTTTTSAAAPPPVMVEASSTSAPTTSAYIIPLSVVMVLIAAILIVVIVILVFVLLKGRAKPKDTEMGYLLNNGNDHIALHEFSLKAAEREVNYQDLFEHIPVIEPIPLSELEHYVDTKIYGGEEDEYAKIKEMDEHFDQIHAFSTHNNGKNRYIDILPFDETRVLLVDIPKKPGTNYINANYIVGFNCMKEYIAAQGPMPQTLGDFWRMMWEQDVPIIVMVTNPTERGQIKCEKYWPDPDLAEEYGIITVSTLTETVQPSFTVREFSLSMSAKPQNKKVGVPMTRQCKQFHFTAWPDFGVPSNINVMLKFVKRIRSEVDLNRGPMVVHCSAGVGRTGTFIAIDVQLQRMAVESTINVKEFVLKMRAQRPFMIQTTGQYEFIYTSLLYEYLHGDLDMNKSELKKHSEKLLDAFPDSEESYLDKEFRGALGTFEPDEKDMSVALSEENRNKNRSLEFVPLNMNRIKVANPSEGDDDYINASLVACTGYRAEYIIAQHPLEPEIENFWRMIMEKHVSKIVVLGPVEEEDAYWPTEGKLDFGGLTLQQMLHEEGDGDSEGVVVRQVEVDWEEHEDYQLVTIFQLASWPTEEEEAPTSITGMLELMKLVKEYTSQELLVVHSSASVQSEASAVFCAINSLSRVLKEKKDTKINVMESVRRLSNQRPGCITSKEQYHFIYQVLIAMDT